MEISKNDPRALAAFEAWMRAHPTLGNAPEFFLKQVEDAGHDQEGPCFADTEIQKRWLTFFDGIKAGLAISLG